ncbi:MAG: glycosyl hydrolase [Armatimonadota bacterium]
MSVMLAQYFLNHRLRNDEIAWQMDEFARGGYQGVFAHARPGLLTPFLSEAWWEAIDAMLDGCRKNGTEFWIWDEDYFPSGLAGGRVVWEDPGLISRQLVFSSARVSGGQIEVDFDPGMLLRAYAYPMQGDGYGEPIDVTAWCGTRRQEETWAKSIVKHSAYSPMIDKVGHPHWRTWLEDNRFALMWMPEQAGDYLIVGVLQRKTDGEHPDLLRPEGIRRFIEMCYEPYYARYKDDFGTLIKGAFTDEPSPGAWYFPWTANFSAEFLADHGYDLLPWLAHIGLDIDERTPLIRHHYRLTQHRLQEKYYIRQLADWCRAHGILFTGHLTRTEWLSLVSTWWPNELRMYRGMDIPYADPLGASVAWPDAAAYSTGLKVVSSAAHLFGKAQAGTDAVAVIGDEAGLRDLKYQFDFQIALGINIFVVHGLSYSLDGPRQDEVPPSIFYQHTEWKYMRHVLDHVRETCDTLTGGEHLCETALLYPSTSLAAQIRDKRFDNYNLPDEETYHRFVEHLLSRQREFDLIDEVTLRESTDAVGTLNTPETYRTIILPYLRFIDEETAEALLRYAKAGGRVIAIGSMPKALSHDVNNPQREWADRSIAFVQSADGLTDLPGYDVQGEGANDIFVLCRRKDGQIHTFAFNRREQTFAGTVEGTAVEIAPRGSVLVTDGKVATGDVPAATETLAEITDGWDVEFAPNHLPLSFWHVERASEPSWEDPFQFKPGFDLLAREADPLPGDDAANYYCRFMLTGEIPDARLVMDDASIAGEWTLYVNNVPITDWRQVTEYDCRNREAQIGHALRAGSVPTLNIIKVEARGANRGVKWPLHLYGAFTCEYRYAHPSFPFVQGAGLRRRIDALLPWDVLGCPTFSGSAVYRKTIDIPEGGAVLDLGRVEDMAVVSIDGRQQAVLAWPPYRCRLEGIAPGEHLLEVEVINAPANRNRAARLPAGLLGPVRIMR